MKISKWEELNEVQNDYHCIIINNQFIYLQTFGETIVSISKDVKKELIIKTLKLFGFDIEFEEAPKLSKREWHLVNYLPEEWWIARKEDMGIYVYNAEPKNGSNGIGTPVFWQGMLLDGRIFPFITPDRAWSVKELRELEVVEG
ncbi:hypothetical protein EOM86_00065 [Candidatus Nomurabacteria bacterium]|nr:hypothetical protein [Candidatus Nomurabacteria bacterium]